MNNYFTLELLYTDETYYRSYGEQLAYDRIERLLNIRDRFIWLSYLLLPLTLIIKCLFVATALNIGTLMARFRTSFRDLLHIAFLAEFVFVAAALFKTFYLSRVAAAPTLQDVQYFYPLSLTNFFAAGEVNKWLIYPMQLINVFELVYWFVLVRLVAKYLQVTARRSFDLVANSYGLALLIWACVVVFLSLSFS
jgi:hypothetical protein